MIFDLDIEFTGFENAEKKTEEMAKEVLFLSMNMMQRIAKKKCPVDTGELRRSIKLNPIQKGSRNYVLSVGVDYGEHVEYGTNFMNAQPYFRPALLEVQTVWVPTYWQRLMTQN